MEFFDLGIEGSLGIVEKSNVDTRGSLTRVWDSDSILGRFRIVQSSLVSNPNVGTLRGLHFQEAPFAENKIIECVSGKVFDVIVDLRKDSATYGSHIEVTLGPLEHYLGVFVPAGCAHGYLTLEADSTLLYFMDAAYSSEHSRGISWDDSSLAIKWPSSPILISERDSNWPDLI